MQLQPPLPEEEQRMQVERGRSLLSLVLSGAEVAAGQLPWDAVFGVLDDCQRAPADKIPDTGD